MSLRRSAIFAAIATCSLIGCDTHSYSEVLRLKSPDGLVEAVVVEGSEGATTSYEYEIFIVNKGGGLAKDAKVASLYGAKRNSNAYGVNLRWQSDGRSLLIEYFESKSTALHKSEISKENGPVIVAMKSGVHDPSAPAGSMLFNLAPSK